MCVKNYLREILLRVTSSRQPPCPFALRQVVQRVTVATALRSIAKTPPNSAPPLPKHRGTVPRHCLAQQCCSVAKLGWTQQRRRRTMRGISVAKLRFAQICLCTDTLYNANPLPSTTAPCPLHARALPRSSLAKQDGATPPPCPTVPWPRLAWLFHSDVPRCRTIPPLCAALPELRVAPRFHGNAPYCCALPLRHYALLFRRLAMLCFALAPLRLAMPSQSCAELCRSTAALFAAVAMHSPPCFAIAQPDPTSPFRSMALPSDAALRRRIALQCPASLIPRQAWLCHARTLPCFSVAMLGLAIPMRVGA